MSQKKSNKLIIEPSDEQNISIFSKKDFDLQNNVMQQSNNEYVSSLQILTLKYPFDRWESLNLYQLQVIAEKLISDLIKIGLKGKEIEKLNIFKNAIISLNEMNEEHNYDIIQSEESKDLITLINILTTKCGLIPKKYGNGLGIAYEWKDW